MSLFTKESAVPFGISLTGNEANALRIGVPALAGDRVERLFGPAVSRGRRGLLELFETGAWLLGVASVGVRSETLERETRAVYDQILAASQGFHIARIWNYVPAINAVGDGSMENYRVFCRGRSLAFEDRLGAGFRKTLPSGSAVGTDSMSLTVVFAASRSPTRHFENPLQVPAYDYPKHYGPRSPSFARATVVEHGGTSDVFISGTAAIRGHETMAPGNTREQLRYTLENLESIAAECGTPLSGASARRTGRRAFKVYLRNADELRDVRRVLEAQLLRAGDAVSYLRADICRSDLSVEIEATILG